jgi:ATP-dependent HslUV protease ATP-binding subunit HslU
MEGSGPDVSRQGVQKDILPVIEGTTVHTKYGLLRTDHMLFIASGAFHVTRPADLIPELQGRFPVRVELESLDRRALERILTEPENSLLRQYRALFAAEGVELELDPSAVREVAALAQEANRRAENIGARRLHGLMHLLLEKELFELPGRSRRKLRVDAARVRERLKDVVEDVDLSRYVL